MKNNQPTIAIIGGGASTLMLAARLDTTRYRVVVYEKNNKLGRKFLVAGKGGFNLTHGASIQEMIAAYYPPSFLSKCLTGFSNTDLRNFLRDLGVNTYIGSSGRVFPEKGVKPIEVLNAFLNKMKEKGVVVKTAHEWKGFHTNGNLLFDHQGEETAVKADYVIFALGGSSWSKTGSRGDWLPYFEQQNIPVVPFQASNCAFQVNWGAELLSKIEGLPLKNIAVKCADEIQKGELMVTQFGMEGSPIYAHSRCIRKQLKNEGRAQIFIDLKPTLTHEKIIEKIERYTSAKTWTKRLKLSLKLGSNQLALIQYYTGKEEFLDINSIAHKIKKLPIPILGIAPIDEAISTVGGIALDAVDENFQLKKRPNHFVMGEMLDWDAPTGGYLLQGCFSMGAGVAAFLNRA